MSVIVFRYNGKYRQLFKIYGNRFPKAQYTFKNFMWAATAVYSRNWAVYDEDNNMTHIMIPYADMINHK